MMMRYFQILTLVLAAAFGHRAEAREFSIPEYQANPGGHVDVPVMLNDASGLCMVNFQVNYDASILQLVSVTRGTLGQSFSEFSSNEEAGVIHTTLANETDLASGGGALVIMRFNLLNGADNTVSADVSLASYDYADSSGVVALSQEEAATAISGQVQAVNDPNIDNFGNGLPDWWEDNYSLSLFSVSGSGDDIDYDGIAHLLEYAFVTDPTRPNVLDQLAFAVRDDDPDLTYYVSASDDLATWDDWPVSFDGSDWSIDAASGFQVSTAVDQGDGTWMLELQWAAAANPMGFMRLGVSR